jgi:chromosome segregation ATPase
MEVSGESTISQPPPMSVRSQGAGSLASRFSTLPRMQEEREQESSTQAFQAEALTKRLWETKVQAERIMKEEMDLTQRLEAELINAHPEWNQWHRKKMDIERQSSDWERGKMEERRHLEAQINQFKSALKAREVQLERLFEEQVKMDKDFQNLNQERDKLYVQLNEAKAGEDDAKGRLESVRSQQNPVEQQVMEIERQLSSQQVRLEEVNSALHRAQESFRQRESTMNELRRRFQATSEDIQRWEGKRKEAEQDVDRAKMLAMEAQSAADEHRGIFEALKVTMEGSQTKTRRAQDAAQHALSLKNKAVSLKLQYKERLESLKSENSGLATRRDELQRQIDELLSQQATIIEAFNKNADTQTNLEYEVHCLDHDEERADKFYRDALEVQRQIESSAVSNRDQYNNEVSLIDSFMAKKIEAERERQEAERILKEAESALQNLKPHLDEFTSRQIELESAYVEERGRINSLEAERNEINRFLATQRDLLENGKQRLGPLREEFNATNMMLINFGHSISKLNRRLGEIEKQFESRRVNFLPRIDQLQNEINDYRNNIGNLEVRLGSLDIPEANPYTAQLHSVNSEREQVRARIVENLCANPPESLINQMKRETEAVMRAELAEGLHSRQVQIENEAKRLAEVKTADRPGLILDDHAKGRMFGEHLTEKRQDYGHLASVVVELAEQHHIMAQ